MIFVFIRDAKNRLTKLAGQVEAGETVVVTRNGRPVCDLVPHRLTAGRYRCHSAAASHRPHRSVDRGGFRRSAAGGLSAFPIAAGLMRRLLDTHILLALLEQRIETLAADVRSLLIDSAGEFHVSIASLWEIAIKTRLGKPHLIPTRINIDTPDGTIRHADAGRYPRLLRALSEA
jgi:prevent-host-death family protein